MQSVHDHSDLNLRVVASGSHLLNRFGNTVCDIEADGFSVDERIFTVIEGGTLETMSKSIGLAIIELSTYFARAKPDMLLVIGDRYDLLPAVISAAMQNIPIGHIQGGERTGTIDESIRHVVTKFSHVHFPANKSSRDFILQMGEKPDHVFDVGCPAIDLLLSSPQMTRDELFATEEVRAKIGKSPIPANDYLLLIQHPVTTENHDSFDQMMATLEAVHALNMQTILISPNIDPGSDPMVAAIRAFQYKYENHQLFTYRHMPLDLFFNLLNHAACMVGNSSAGIRESSYFGTPCVNIGSRQKNRDYGSNVMNVGHDKKSIEQAIAKQIAHGKYDIEYIYGKGDAGQKIANIIASMTVSTQK